MPQGTPVITRQVKQPCEKGHGFLFFDSTEKQQNTWTRTNLSHTFYIGFTNKLVVHKVEKEKVWTRQESSLVKYKQMEAETNAVSKLCLNFF